MQILPLSVADLQHLVRDGLPQWISSRQLLHLSKRRGKSALERVANAQWQRLTVISVSFCAMAVETGLADPADEQMTGYQ